MDLGETEWEGVDWIHLAEDGDHWQALFNTAMNLYVWSGWSVGELVT
jgi:hypothetical protein